MQKLKELIQALMEAFISFKRTFIAQQSLPNDVYSTSSVQASETESRSVSPCDGWASLQSDSNTTGIFVLYNGRVNSTLSFTNGGWAKQYIPVRKGDSVAYRVTSTGATLYFIRSIGGGYKRFIFNALQRFGGGLCLSSLTSLARYLGSLARKHCHQTAKLITSSRIFLTGYGFKCRLMGILLLDVTIREMSRYVMTRQEFTHHQVTQEADILRASSWLKKEILSPLKSAEVTRQIPYFGRFQQSARLSFCQGGVA